MTPRTLFSAEHELFRDQVRRFILAEITPHHAEWEKAGIVPRSVWRKAGEAGLPCTGLPEEYGGAGGAFLFGAVTIAQLAGARAPGPTIHLHSELVGPSLVHSRTAAPTRRRAHAMATVEAVLASLAVRQELVERRGRTGFGA